MKSILRQAQQIFIIKEEFKALFSKKTAENKIVTTTPTKVKVEVLEEEMV